MATRTTATVSVSLPPAMLEELDKKRRSEHRTRSELVREALRAYLALPAGPQEPALPDELEAIREGRAELARGEYVMFED